MKYIFILFSCILVFGSCNQKTADKDAEKKTLNEQSAKCIAVMNEAESMKNDAAAAGNTDKMQAQQTRMDSAARENALIGQKLTDLDK